MSQLKPQEVVRLGDIQMANHLPFVLFGGMNVLESKDLAFEIADYFNKKYKFAIFSSHTLKPFDFKKVKNRF